MKGIVPEGQGSEGHGSWRAKFLKGKVQGFDNFTCWFQVKSVSWLSWLYHCYYILKITLDMECKLAWYFMCKLEQLHVKRSVIGEGYCNLFHSVFLSLCHSVCTPFCTYNSKTTTSITLKIWCADTSCSTHRFLQNPNMMKFSIRCVQGICFCCHIFKLISCNDFSFIIFLLSKSWKSCNLQMCYLYHEKGIITALLLVSIV